jgi:mannitol operon transcriptional antiterminator
LNNYISDSQRLLSEFELVTLSNSSNFDITVKQIVSCLENCDDHDYLANKLIERFKVSPLAIPNTGLALLHTSSSHVTESTFKIFELEHQVETLSMNFENEGLTRILLMLTPLDASESVRELMISISQSIIENHLYTEIYKAGNQEIIYQLLSKLFTDRIKQLEN